MPFLLNETGLRFAVIPGHVLADSLTASLIIKGAFALRPGSAVELLPEAEQPPLDGDVPWDDDPARGLRTPSDFALYKPGTDILLAGHCHAPGGRPVPFTQVVFGVGAFRKSALVFGDRLIGRAFRDGFSDPLPFTRMPLDWSRAFGGAGFVRNPVGRGAAEVKLEDGSRFRPAPNIETPGNLHPGGNAQVEPTGFGPLDPNWPQRAAKVGSYGGRWLAERWPWQPLDFDWSFFNSAPADQFLDGVYLRGDEPLEFVNLHPEEATLKTKLPGLAVRAFIGVRRGTLLEFREVPVRIDTLLADMDAGHVVLTWRGVTPAASLKLKEIEDYFILTEPLGRPLCPDLAGYEAIYRQRRQELRQEFEVPPIVMEPLVMPEITPPDTAWADRLGELADQMIADAAAVSTPPPPVTALGGAPPPPLAVPPPPPPPASVAAATQLMKADWNAVGARDPEFLKKYPPPDFSELEEDEAELAAFTGLPEEEEDTEAAEWTRERVVEHRARGGHFDNQELVGLDLSGLEFDGVRFVGADLSETDLSGASLQEADLSGATLTQARLAGARLDRARLRETDLSEVAAEAAVFDGADLADADFTGGTLTRCRFVGANAPRASFSGCALADADFEGARLAAADFAEATLTAACFRGADVSRADMDNADATRATFEGATAINLRAAKTLLRGANFRDCHADRAAMEDAILNEADFRGARLRRATLTGARLERAVFALADLREAKLDDARLHEATFVGVNFFRGTLENADLTEARFLDCNLYEVEFFQAKLETAIFQECNLKGTKREG